MIYYPGEVRIDQSPKRQGKPADPTSRDAPFDRTPRIDDPSVPALPLGAMRECCLTICPIVIGLLALFFFLWMGGVFALVGPWLIFAARVLITRRAEARGASRGM
jgi:hypothetical protein